MPSPRMSPRLPVSSPRAEHPLRDPSRRLAVGSALGVASGLAAAGAVYAATTRNPHAGPAAPGTPPPAADDQLVAFRGPHQAGIITPAQDRMHFVALDVVTDSAQELRDLLTTWTRAAERMTYGAEAAPGGAVGLGPYGVPTDTGEALDLPPSHLSITIGYGPALFERFGLGARRPQALVELPAFRGDDLDPAASGGDICIQACADDPQVAVHAVRNLIRLGFGVVAVRWSQLGFGRTSSTSTAQVTPRNLFGFKDGTNNLMAEDAAGLAEHVWIAPSDVAGESAWLAGGSYLVARRVRMHIEVWDRTNLQEQQDVFGRGKLKGEPLGATEEFDPIDFAATRTDGLPAIPLASHVRLAHADNLKGVRILRRGYNFIDGTDGQGHLNAGLFFIAFMRNPGTQFVPMQQALAATDLLNEYIEHTGSALFATPPGLTDTQDWGSQLFG